MSAPFPIDTTIPAAPNDPADDQPKMQTNFANIDGYLTVDHIEPGEMNAGYHSQVHMLNQSAPGIGTANGVLYCNDDGTGSWPVWQNAAGSQQLQGKALRVANGYTFLSPGLFLIWGFVPGSSATTTPVSFNTLTLSAPAYSVQVTPIRAASSPGDDFSTVVVTGSVTTTGFTIGNVGGHTMQGWYWIAIGPR